MGRVIRTLLSSPKSKSFLTFNDSPRCFPAQDSFAIHLVLLVTAHYCKGHAFLLGKDMWRDLSNPFQKAAPSLFLSHLSSLHLTKCKAFCKGGGSPKQNFIHHCSCFTGVLAPPGLSAYLTSMPKAPEKGVKLLCTHLHHL